MSTWLFSKPAVSETQRITVLLSTALMYTFLTAFESSFLIYSLWREIQHSSLFQTHITIPSGHAREYLFCYGAEKMHAFPVDLDRIKAIAANNAFVIISVERFRSFVCIVFLIMALGRSRRLLRNSCAYGCSV